MAITWHGPAIDADVVNVGQLALIHPLLERLDVRNAIDRHIHTDPQLEFSHGQVLSVLLAARLAQPTALIHVADWAEGAGADILWQIPPEKLNDDRLGRALDAFFEYRHTLAAEITATALRWAEVPLNNLHFDTTHLVLYGAYDTSQPRPELKEPLRGDDQLAPAHITHGYLTKYRMIQVGVTAAVDDLGAIPIACHCLDGNRNGFTAIHEQFQLLQAHFSLPEQMILTSDRGTFSAAHAATLFRHQQHILCAVPWNAYRQMYDDHAATLLWREASYRSQEQQRRRDTPSSLPIEHYDLAVVRHELSDPKSDGPIPCRVIFVRSTAGATEERTRREKNIDKIRNGLIALAAKLERAHPSSTPASIQRQAVRLLGHRDAAAFFQWELVQLTAAERAALPLPPKGYTLQKHRLIWSFDAAAAAAAARYDGLSALLTTAPRTESADQLFARYKRQAYVERLHHESKSPLAVCPLFLKTPKRVEALVCLLQLALLARQALERVYRKQIATDAPKAERRITADSLLRHFRVCGVFIEHNRFGRTVRQTRETTRQQEIRRRLGFPTIGQILRTNCPSAPSG